jgi:alkylated DNA repair dioxygenase AlkB
VTLVPGFYGRVEADRLFDALRSEVDWQAKTVRLFGKTHPLPRLTAWHGDAGAAYMYSGITHEPEPWTALLAEVRARVEAASGTKFNAVLLNRYRDGQDRMGWHADDEPELGPRPTIASLSLGVTRTFQMRHRTRKDVPRLDFELGHGSLLIMRPPTQAWWLHKVPRRARVKDERINLTFRLIVG